MNLELDPDEEAAIKRGHFMNYTHTPNTSLDANVQSLPRRLLSFWTLPGRAFAIAMFIGVPTDSPAQTSPLSPQRPSLQNLGQVPNVGSALANGIAPHRNVVVGQFYSVQGTSEAMSWADGNITLLGTISPYNQSIAYAANAYGSVITGYSYSGSGGLYSEGAEAFRWVGGTMTGIGTLNNNMCEQGTQPPYSQALAINADGSVIVGTSASSISCSGEPFMWTASGGMVGLTCPDFNSLGYCSGDYATGVSADGSVIVGYSFSTDVAGAEGFEAWRWAAGTFNTFLSINNTADVRAVTPHGNIVLGNCICNPNGSPYEQPFLWNNRTGAFTYLGLLPRGSQAEGTALSSDGSVVVGWALDINVETKAVRWTKSRGLQRIDRLLAACGVDVSGWALTQAYGISADGTVIVGSGDYHNNPAGWIAVLPIAEARDAGGGCA